MKVADQKNMKLRLTPNTGDPFTSLKKLKDISITVSILVLGIEMFKYLQFYSHLFLISI